MKLIFLKKNLKLAYLFRGFSFCITLMYIFTLQSFFYILIYNCVMCVYIRVSIGKVHRLSNVSITKKAQGRTNPVRNVSFQTLHLTLYRNISKEGCLFLLFPKLAYLFIKTGKIKDCTNDTFELSDLKIKRDQIYSY